MHAVRFGVFHQAEATLVDNASMADEPLTQYTVSQALDIIGNIFALTACCSGAGAQTIFMHCI